VVHREVHSPPGRKTIKKCHKINYVIECHIKTVILLNCRRTAKENTTSLKIYYKHLQGAGQIGSASFCWGANMIIDHTNKEWLRRQRTFGKNRHNGAKYYSQEIVANIIPHVETDRNWITVNVAGQGCDHAIVFVHSNLRPDHYDWLKKYDDLVLVCGVPETVEKVKHLGKAIYLPLSIDVDYVKRFAIREEDRQGVAFVGRAAKKRYEGVKLPEGVRCLSGLPRAELLTEMARLEKVYAVGRIAIEAKALGVKVLPYDPRYPDPELWQVIDNREAARMLQQELDKIDGKKQYIVDHTHPVYIAQREKIGKSRWNGAYYYSREITEKIIPNVKTDRPWITLNVKDPALGRDGAIVFVHNHKQCPECYEWLSGYKDLIFICSEKDDMPKLEHLGTPVYLPLSVDVEYVKKFRKGTKTKEIAYVGRKERAKDIAEHIPAGTEYVSGLPRKELLTRLADYKTVYAVDRVAIEAQILGCEVLPYPGRWEVFDNSEAAKVLQAKLDEIDHPEEQADETEPEPDESWTKPDLQAWAYEHDIEVKRRDTKKQMLEKILEAKGRG